MDELGVKELGKKFGHRNMLKKTNLQVILE
jgi:hypothetical protein